MAKVFRLDNIQGNNNIVDWQDSQPYGTKAISEITDPDGATAKKEITSIPSPFARIDLVKTAFREVINIARGINNSNNIEKKKAALSGLTIYHKMVSEMFDVAQLFFNIDRFKDKFEILVWDREKDLDLDNILGNTLNLYLKSDAVGSDSYNFRKMKRVYMLNYIGPDRPSDLNIVGGTSPATLFFSSSNDLDYVTQNILFDNDRPFDKKYVPLFRRNFEFQKYLFALRLSNSQFGREFPEVNDYLDLTYDCLSNQQKAEISQLTVTSIDDYEPINIGGNGQDYLEILGRPFHKKSNKIDWESDFAIRSTVYKGEKVPLVLPVEWGNMYTNLTYTEGPWEQSFRAPYFDKTPWKDRLLPELYDQYPYLTISDFLADTIVRIPYELNSQSFYDGGLLCKNENDEHSYLLPLKPLFFQLFTVKELMDTVSGTNKPMFEFIENASGIKAILRIPIKKGYIEYSRIYFEGMLPNLESNDGGLVESKMGMGVMPLIRFPENVNKHYRIAMFDKGKRDTVLAFYEGTETVMSRRTTRAEKDLAGRGCSHEAYILENNFDRILVKVGDVEGFVVPLFRLSNNHAASVFTFAVDYGTTNTHIEYCSDANKNPRPFDITLKEKQLHQLHKRYTDPDIRLAFEQDFIPDTIGDKYSFPMRTVFATRVGLNLENNPKPLADGNIPFLYEKDFIPNWNHINTELKWGGVPDRLLEMHLETLFILMRNKVAINGGNLSATKLIWFYPASMSIGKINRYKQLWKDAYQSYFGSNIAQNLISISESKAPYLHFIRTQGAADEVVTIDIGGGTSDVFIVERQEDRMLMSFRYASNSIFGDAYNSNPSKNGFVCKYSEQFKKTLESNRLSELLRAFRQIEDQGKSSDIAAFLFSLVGERVDNNKELDFFRKLSNDDSMRYVFIIFYGALFYYIAKVMKANRLMKPKTIAFSGNGSRTICILSDDNSMVAKFAKLIFDGVYGDSKGTIEVMMESNPKIATCKGGIESPEPQPYDTIYNIKTVFVGNDFSHDDNQLTYADINDGTKEGVVESVEEFFNLLFDLHKNNHEFFINSLSAEPTIFNEVKDFCLGEEGRQILQVSLSKGIANKRQSDGVNDETPLEETLFFYPLVGLLHDLAFTISKMN